jgi:hypothetical protein
VLYHDWAIDVLSNHKSQITNHSRDAMLASNKKQKIILLHGKKRPQTNKVDGWMKWV